MKSPSFTMSLWLVKKNAFKVTLVASSAFSRGILTKDQHPYPLVYVKGGGLEGKKIDLGN